MSPCPLPSQPPYVWVLVVLAVKLGHHLWSWGAMSAQSFHSGTAKVTRLGPTSRQTNSRLRACIGCPLFSFQWLGKEDRPRSSFPRDLAENTCERLSWTFDDTGSFVEVHFQPTNHCTSINWNLLCFQSNEDPNMMLCTNLISASVEAVKLGESSLVRKELVCVYSLSFDSESSLASNAFSKEICFDRNVVFKFQNCARAWRHFSWCQTLLTRLCWKSVRNYSVLSRTMCRRGRRWWWLSLFVNYSYSRQKNNFRDSVVELRARKAEKFRGKKYLIVWSSQRNLEIFLCRTSFMLLARTTYWGCATVNWIMKNDFVPFSLRCTRFADVFLECSDWQLFVADLLRRLSKSQDTLFCGRIQLFLARLFPLSEKSGKPISDVFPFEVAVHITILLMNETVRDQNN